MTTSGFIPRKGPTLQRRLVPIPKQTAKSQNYTVPEQQTTVQQLSANHNFSSENPNPNQNIHNMGPRLSHPAIFENPTEMQNLRNTENFSSGLSPSRLHPTKSTNFSQSQPALQYYGVSKSQHASNDALNYELLQNQNNNFLLNNQAHDQIGNPHSQVNLSYSKSLKEPFGYQNRDGNSYGKSYGYGKPGGGGNQHNQHFVQNNFQNASNQQIMQNQANQHGSFVNLQHVPRCNFGQVQNSQQRLNNPQTEAFQHGVIQGHNQPHPSSYQNNAPHASMNQSVNQQIINQQTNNQHNINHQHLSQQNISHQNSSYQNSSHQNLSHQNPPQNSLSHQNPPHQNLSHQNIQTNNASSNSINQHHNNQSYPTRHQHPHNTHQQIPPNVPSNVPASNFYDSNVPHPPPPPHAQQNAANLHASNNPALPSHPLTNNHLIPIGQERLPGNIFNIVSYNNPELGCIPKWLKLYITVRNRNHARSHPTTLVPETDSVDNTVSLLEDLGDLSEDDFENRHSRQASHYLYEKLDMILSQETSSQADISHLPYALEVINKVESAEKREVFRRYQQLLADLKKVHRGFDGSELCHIVNNYK